jgi:hypothetical protein
MLLLIVLLLRKVGLPKMLALIACILFVLASFGIQVGVVHLGWLAGAFIAAHCFVNTGWPGWSFTRS